MSAENLVEQCNAILPIMVNPYFLTLHVVSGLCAGCHALATYAVKSSAG